MKDGIVADWHGALFFSGTLAKVGIRAYDTCKKNWIGTTTTTQIR
jgi:hypothetical protein